VHFVDAWLQLTALDAARMLVPVVFLLLAVFVTGRASARIAAIGIAASLPFLRELDVTRPLLAGWIALWLAIAWQSGVVSASSKRAITTRIGGMEPGGVGLMVGATLLVLLIASVARQDLDPDASRRASYGLLVLSLGLVHLMLRRNLLRSAVAFGALGLGIQILEGAARQADVARVSPSPGILIATGAAAALTARLAVTRERAAGTPWVSDAHDLRD